MSNRWSQVLKLKPLDRYPKQTFELALPHGKMLNRVCTSTTNHQLKVYVDGYKVVVTYNRNHHYQPLDDLEKLAIYGNLVDKQDDLHKVIPYDEDIDVRKPLHMNFKSLYRKYAEGQLVLEPAYQRGFVWTAAQQEAYLLGLFHETATIPSFSKQVRTSIAFVQVSINLSTSQLTIHLSLKIWPTGTTTNSWKNH